MEKKLIITTSWDDGHELDERLAALLEKYNLKGTFYIPISNSEQPVMNTALMKEIGKNHDIGGHTVNHIYLNTLGKEDAKYEVSKCKVMLEEILGNKVEAFCYPGGKYSQRDIDLVNEAGFLFGRTTRLLRTTLNTESKLMDTSVQAYNHSKVVLVAHCLKNNYLSPIIQNLFFLKGDKNFQKLIEDMIERLSNTGGVFHLWGHSWEIEQNGLWQELESVFKIISNRKNVDYLDNTECWKYAKENKF